MLLLTEVLVSITNTSGGQVGVTNTSGDRVGVTNMGGTCWGNSFCGIKWCVNVVLSIDDMLSINQGLPWSSQLWTEPSWSNQCRVVCWANSGYPHPQGNLL